MQKHQIYKTLKKYENFILLRQINKPLQKYSFLFLKMTTISPAHIKDVKPLFSPGSIVYYISSDLANISRNANNAEPKLY